MNGEASRDGPASLEGRWYHFQDLFRHRIYDVLLVATPYESFILAEDGQPQALMASEFVGLEVRHIPTFRHVATGSAALELCRRGPRPDLIIATLQVADMDAATLAARLRREGMPVPVVLLAFDSRALATFPRTSESQDIERAFLWQGDAAIFLAIVKHVEDRLNLASDTGAMGVQAILVIEDSVRYYSSFLPAIYAEVIEQSRKLVPEGLNLAHKMLRVQARPKIILATSYEEALHLFSDHQENILGIISDVEFPREGRPSHDAGVEFARMVRLVQPDIPIILHSRDPGHEAAARDLGTSFLLKGSPLLLEELRRFMIEYFCFGDFVFRLPDGREVDRARDLKELEEKLRTVPAASLAYHAGRNHFSSWLKARTEFAIAQRLRPRRLADFESVEHMRELLIRSIAEHRERQARATIADFHARSFDESVGFARLGGGSLGGKARGLAFVNLLLTERELRDRFPGVRITVPRTLVLGSDLFDEVVHRSALHEVVVGGSDAGEVRRRFLAARLPRGLERDLAAFLRVAREPLAVRSSSLLEDSQFLPFAGIYETHMLANDHPDPRVRLAQLREAILKVFASTYSARARAYLDAAGYRLEEERMAVVVQGLVGASHGNRFYPDIAGVARSHNYYPLAPMRAEDGIAAVALGFGEAVVAGEVCFRFCPRYPHKVVSFSSVDDVLRNSQRGFHALRLGSGSRAPAPAADWELGSFGLEVADQDGTLAAVGSTWSAENDAIYDGVARPGVRVVSFAGVLKHGLFPLAEVLDALLGAGSEGIGAPVEIEFAVNLSTPPGAPREFGFLQLRPLALTRELVEVQVGGERPEQVLCRSASVLGHGRFEGILDLVVVDPSRFDRARSRDVAAEVARMNARLLQAGTPYVLIGVGRWGSSEPLLGIPVDWEQIAGARVIVEAGFRDFRVTPSQGTHFFQNLTVSGVGYFTVNPEMGEGELDWGWLAAQPAVEEASWVRHLRLARPLTVIMDGRQSRGVILRMDGRAEGD